MRLEAFDIESAGVDRAYGLQPYRATLRARMLASGVKQAWLTSYATARRGDDGEIETDGDLFPSVAVLRALLMSWAESKTYVVGWNTPFDVAWLIALGLRDEVMAVKWLDAMLLYKHLTSCPRYLPIEHTKAPKIYGLKEAVAKFYPDEAGYEKAADLFVDMEDNKGLDDLLVYNKFDSKFTLRLCEKFLAEMTASQRKAALLEAECIPLVAETLVQGITTDTVAATKLSSKLTDDANHAFVTLKLTDPQNISTEVLASPAKLRVLLYETWGLPVQHMTDGGKDGLNPQPATDKEALADLADIDPRAKLLRDYREAQNNRTKFAEGVIKSTAYNGDGCVRPGARIFGTYTGRLTYSSKQGKGKAEVPTGIAIHQWKKGKDFRELLTVPEGYTLLEFDFAGQEFKWMAVESADYTMLELCRPGEDPHSFMAARIEGSDYRSMIARVKAEDPVAANARKLGKVGNLSLQYRTSAKTLRVVAKTQYDVRMSEIESVAIHATYQTSYTGVPRYWKRQIAMARTQGWVETQAGRRVQLTQGGNWDRDNKWAYESTAINFPIQGVGADQKYLALAVVKNYLPQVEGHFYYELHDGMFFIVPDRYVEKAAVEIKHLLSNLPYKKAWGKSFPILFPVDAKLGKSWGQLKEFNE